MISFSWWSAHEPGEAGEPGAFMEPLGPGRVEWRLERQVRIRPGYYSGHNA